MKLEVGKYYRTRDGRKAGPIEENAWQDGDYKFSGMMGLAEITFDEDGFYIDEDHEYDFDLIAEWVDEPVMEAAAAALVVSSNQLMIDRAPNGGWIVIELGEAVSEPRIIGAYTTAAEMIAALSMALGVTK